MNCSYSLSVAALVGSCLAAISLTGQSSMTSKPPPGFTPPAPKAAPIVMTDVDGHYAYPNLPRDPYQMSASELISFRVQTLDVLIGPLKIEVANENLHPRQVQEYGMHEGLLSEFEDQEAPLLDPKKSVKEKLGLVKASISSESAYVRKRIAYEAPIKLPDGEGWDTLQELDAMRRIAKLLEELAGRCDQLSKGQPGETPR